MNLTQINTELERVIEEEITAAMRSGETPDAETILERVTDRCPALMETLGVLLAKPVSPQVLQRLLFLRLFGKPEREACKSFHKRLTRC
jgi:hypothetical protein